MTANQTEPSDLVATTDILSDGSAVTKMPTDLPFRLRVHLDNPSKIKIHEDGTVDETSSITDSGAIGGWTLDTHDNKSI